MRPSKDSDRLVRAAFHEAGHVIVRHHHGLRTPSVMIRPDGTGVTFSGEGLVDDLGIRLDVNLAGYAAEGLFDQETLFPLVERFIAALRRFIERGSPAADDYGACVEMAMVERPDWTDREILDAMQDSNTRVTTVLEQRWDGARRLANELLAAPSLSLAEHEILAAIG